MSYETMPIVTELDAARIRELGSRLQRFGAGLPALSSLIEKVEQQADIVAATDVGHDVVTVNSTVSFRDELTGSVQRVTVVYPNDMSLGRRRISVLSPVGSALLGQRVGQVVHAALPDGTPRPLRVLELHYQPEAAGHFTV